MQNEPVTRSEADRDAVRLADRQKERAEDQEERRLTRAELLAAQTARMEQTLQAHENHLKIINSNIEHFAGRLGDLEKLQIKRDTEAEVQLENARQDVGRRITTMTLVLSILMFLAAVASILATTL